MRIFSPAMLLAPLLAACQTAPVAPTSTAPLAQDGGIVIGTMSYAPGQSEPRHALVKLARIGPQAQRRQDYLLDANFDTRAANAVFAGALPSGVYVVEEALSDSFRFVPGTLKMPFEIRSGEVTDAGNYPMEQRAALLRATLAR